MNAGPQGPGPYTPPKSNNTAIIVVVIIAAGFVLLMIMAILAAILFPVFARARQSARASACLQNVQQISTAMMQYQTSWDDRCPPAKDWQTALEPHVKSPVVWRCPADQSGRPSYAMNTKLSGIRRADVAGPADVVMIFESSPGDNQGGGPELLPSEPRHMGTHMIGCADGHVKQVRQPDVGSLIWQPTKP